MLEFIAGFIFGICAIFVFCTAILGTADDYDDGEIYDDEDYPDDPRDFIDGYVFEDDDGSELVHTIRVEQMIEHYFKNGEVKENDRDN